MNTWTIETKNLLLKKTESYSQQELINIGFTYLTNLLLKIEQNYITEENELKIKIENVINALPSIKTRKTIELNPKHLNELSNLQNFVEQKYQFVKKNNYRKKYVSMGIPLGMPFGLPFGLAIGKIGYSLIIGMILGIITGYLIGKYRDKRAENDNKVL
jgi:hypothetical protein